VLSGLTVLASDGGEWASYPTSTGCGIFHLYATKHDGDDVLRETVSDSLAVGDTLYDLIGTDGNGVGTTQALHLALDGTQLAVPNHGSATVVVGMWVVDASFSWWNKNDGGQYYVPVDRVAVCGVNADGYQDSYGTLTISLTRGSPPPSFTLTSIGVFATDGGQWNTYPTTSCGFFHLFVSQGDDSVLRETVNDVLQDVTSKYFLIGTDGNGASATQHAELVFSGVSTPLHIPNGGSASLTLPNDPTRVLTASFIWFNKNNGGLTYLDRVAVCAVDGDGYQDSYGTLTITIQPAYGSLALAFQ